MRKEGSVHTHNPSRASQFKYPQHTTPAQTTMHMPPCTLISPQSFSIILGFYQPREVRDGYLVENGVPEDDLVLDLATVRLLVENELGRSGDQTAGLFLVIDLERDHDSPILLVERRVDRQSANRLSKRSKRTGMDAAQGVTDITLVF